MAWNDLLYAVKQTAREKDLDEDNIFVALEQGLERVAKKRYGAHRDIRVHIHRMTGEMQVRYVRRLDQDILPGHEGTTTQAPVSSVKEGSMWGDLLPVQAPVKDENVVEEILPPLPLDRAAAEVVRTVLHQTLRGFERQKQYEAFKDRVGEIIVGVVKRVDYSHLYIDLGKAEGYLPKQDLIGHESYSVHDRIKVYIAQVRPEPKGPQIFLSRTHPGFVAALFKQEVPEIYDGVVEIKAVARDPGSRAKVAVWSKDPSVDPIGACVGVRGTRIQCVTQECRGEKIDVIPWSTDITTFVVNALAPAEVKKVVITANARRLGVVVDDEQQSIAIGRGGQNVRLASKLTGMTIDIMTESEESQQTAQRRQALIDALDVDDLLAQLLLSEGFENYKDIVQSPQSLIDIEGLTPEIAEEIYQRAKYTLEKEEQSLYENFLRHQGDESLLQLKGMTLPLAVSLAEKGVCTPAGLAELSSDEILDLVPRTILTPDQAEKIVLAARNLIDSTEIE